jgi:hypothetical protein
VRRSRRRSCLQKRPKYPPFLEPVWPCACTAWVCRLILVVRPPGHVVSEEGAVEVTLEANPEDAVGARQSTTKDPSELGWIGRERAAIHAGVKYAQLSLCLIDSIYSQGWSSERWRTSYSKIRSQGPWLAQGSCTYARSCIAA